MFIRGHSWLGLSTVVSVFSPAKLNLFLAVTGRQADGFHDLVSVVAPLALGDQLEARSADGTFTLECDVAEVPADGSNLVLKAAAAFAQATGWRGGAHFRLRKRIPVGAGLGGGSSNAVAALRALNQLAGTPLDEPRLLAVATTLGSDCALFVRGAPLVMRGRGERLEELPAPVLARLRGRRVLLFKPSFGIATPWAYRRMVARGTDYLPAAEADRRVAAWCGGGAPVEPLLFNNMEPAAFEKYLALPALLTALRRDLGVAAAMSGSGSACFAVLGDDFASAPLVQRLRACWGDGAWVQETRLA